MVQIKTAQVRKTAELKNKLTKPNKQCETELQSSFVSADGGGFFIYFFPLFLFKRTE